MCLLNLYTTRLKRNQTIDAINPACQKLKAKRIKIDHNDIKIGPKIDI